ncbi:MAG TPA: triose-phosphate isomerase [Verrucomicrobiae bacterium]|nr:triose-phosphate isomerase [Verrucomicrobiae bacterium]
MHVLYGGSVSKANVHEFAKYPTIDGALVGAASLNPDNFFAIIKEFHRESIHKS